MYRFLLILVIAAAGFWAGWQTRDRLTANSATAPPPPAYQARPNIQRAPQRPAPPPVRETPVEAIKGLLAKRDFEGVIQSYDDAIAADPALRPELRAQVLAYLQQAMARGEDDALLGLVDSWLALYYEDIDILLLLAEYQGRRGYPDEAARVFQFAFTYALDPAEREQVSAAFDKLVEKTDADLGNQGRWAELLGFYRMLATIDLDRPRHRLREAAISLELGNEYSARELLLPLRESELLGSEARDMLARMESWQQSSPAPPPPGQAVPLRRRGQHYLVDLSLNGTSAVTLLIDTGASVTVLKQESFKRLSRNSHYDYLGWRLFNTANGFTRGNIYRAQGLRIGDEQLANVDLAILDFRQDPDIDGLLGMNVLQNFRFQIDQDRELLYLQRR
jgi:clan AA aspartic protease (TIGR02281 family)